MNIKLKKTVSLQQHSPIEINFHSNVIFKKETTSYVEKDTLKTGIYWIMIAKNLMICLRKIACLG
jgi:hypothetical protein